MNGALNIINTNEVNTMQDGQSGKPRHMWAIEEARERNLAEINGTFDPDEHRAWCLARKRERRDRHEQAYRAAKARRRPFMLKRRGTTRPGGGKKRGIKGSKRPRRV